MTSLLVQMELDAAKRLRIENAELKQQLLERNAEVASLTMVIPDSLRNQHNLNQELRAALKESNYRYLVLLERVVAYGKDETGLDPGLFSDATKMLDEYHKTGMKAKMTTTRQKDGTK